MRDEVLNEVLTFLKNVLFCLKFYCRDTAIMSQILIGNITTAPEEFCLPKPYAFSHLYSD